ncbi:MAG: transcription termination factor NusA [Chloroflexota bacterium]
MKNEFVLAFNEVLEDKQLPKEIVLDALQAAMVSAYRRAVNASNAQLVNAEIDPETGHVLIYAEKEVVESVQDERTEVTLTNALKVDPEAKLGNMVVVETTPRNFGRVAAQTARQVIQQRIREAERDAQFNHFSKQEGEILSGVIQAVNNTQGITVGLEMKAEGIMPRNHSIPGERVRVHDRLRALLLEVKNSPRGPQLILSRAHRNFLRRLLENEVPEIYHGMVEIRSIAREPGQRSKVAVAALQPGIDPVGACVGIRGVRIQAIVRELNDEKIDVIEWNADPALYIAKALSPARVSGVYLNDASKGPKTATVVVPEDQLSLAIGRDGQNARLAAKLTSWRIDIKSLPEAAADSLHKLESDPDYARIAENESDVVPQVESVLAKKSEGRPVTPEEYAVLTQFVDRVERGLIRQRQSEQRQEEELQRIASAGVPQAAFDIPLAEFEVSDRVYAVISEAGFQTVGDLLLQVRVDPDSVFRLNGMGPKAWSELQEALNRDFPPEVEAEQAEEAEAVEAPAKELVAAVEAPTAEVEATEAPEGVEAAEAEPVPTEVTAEAPAEEAVSVAAEEETPQAAAEQVAEPEAEAAEAPQEAVAGGPAEAPAEELALVVSEEEAEPTLEELFALSTDVMDFAGFEEEEEDEEEEGGDSGTQKKKKKKKKKKFVELEYDPDQDVMVVRKKHKRGEEGWEEEW